MTQSSDQLRDTVRRKYAEVAIAPQTGCCAPTPCCDSDSQGEENFNMIGDAYEGVSGYVADADLGLSCGVPVEHAGLRAGQTVLDLGSGAGLDVFVARHEVGATGHVIGVDMTAEMLAMARQNAAQKGILGLCGWWFSCCFHNICLALSASCRYVLRYAVNDHIFCICSCGMRWYVAQR